MRKFKMGEICIRCEKEMCSHLIYKFLYGGKWQQLCSDCVLEILEAWVFTACQKENDDGRD